MYGSQQVRVACFQVLTFPLLFSFEIANMILLISNFVLMLWIWMIQIISMIFTVTSISGYLLLKVHYLGFRKLLSYRLSFWTMYSNLRWRQVFVAYFQVLTFTLTFTLPWFFVLNNKNDPNNNYDLNFLWVFFFFVILIINTFLFIFWFIFW